MRARLFWPIAVLSLATTLGGCALHVHDDRDRTDATRCSVACPAKGEASAGCVSPQIPACTCEPAPVATCTGAL